MVKVKLTKVDGNKLIVFGLSEENVQRLKGGQPILIHGSDLDLPDDYVIAYGKTEESIMQDLDYHNN